MQQNLILVMQLQAAQKAGMKLALHLEPYASRSAESVRQDLQHIYRLLLDPDSPAFELSDSLLKTPCACDDKAMCPVMFVYDSYRLQPSSWQQLFGRDGGLRCSTNDVFAIALWLDADGGEQVPEIFLKTSLFCNRRLMSQAGYKRRF